jgi:hypothetical protein
VRRPARLKQGGEMGTVVPVQGVPLGQVACRSDQIPVNWNLAGTSPHLLHEHRWCHLGFSPIARTAAASAARSSA